MQVAGKVGEMKFVREGGFQAQAGLLDEVFPKAIVGWLERAVVDCAEPCGQSGQ